MIKLFGKTSTNGYMTKEMCGIISSNQQKQLDSMDKKLDKLIDYWTKAEK